MQKDLVEDDSVQLLHLNEGNYYLTLSKKALVLIKSGNTYAIKLNDKTLYISRDTVYKKQSEESKK